MNEETGRPTEAVDRPAIQPPSQSAEDDESRATQVLRFTLGEQTYGLEVGYIYEVVRMVAITELPDSPPDVLGVIDYRGTVVPIVDLRVRFGLEVKATTLTTPIVIAWTGEYAVGLVVEAVYEVLAIAPQEIMAPEDFGQQKKHIAAVAKVEDGLLLIMNPAGLISEEMVERVQHTDPG